jgi:sarcosine oxidase subunit alpha
MTGYRLPRGGHIDRARRIAFRFDNRPLEGRHGDTLASALLANGIHLVGRSFKYHRPRGILSAGAEEPNALVTLRRDDRRTTPNLRATQIELYQGLQATSQNRWPCLRFDINAAASLFAPLLGAGFYYKTFMQPAWAWKKLYEPAIRRMAGLGEAPRAADPDRYAHRYAHCDVLIVGAGPAGLAAARQATAQRKRIILCDEQAAFGGSLLAESDASIDGVAAQDWVDQALRELASYPDAILLPRTTAFTYGAQNMVSLAERVTDHLAVPPPEMPRERLWQVRAKEVVIATGAIERPLVFPGNDIPGVMLADAARIYVERYAVAPGTRALIATTHDSGYRAALSLARAGVAIAAIVDGRKRPRGPLVDAARDRGLAVMPAARILEAMGRIHFHGATIGSIDGGPDRSFVDADLLLMNGGWTPSVHLFAQSRGTLRYDAAIGAFLPDRPAQLCRVVGAANGRRTLREALDDGAGVAGHWRAAEIAATRGGEDTPHVSTPGRFAFVDFQNDVTTKDIGIALDEGFKSVEHVKRYTTAGMATDQGKTSNLAVLREMSSRTGCSVGAIGTTTFRPPYTPVTFGTIAGFHRGATFDPERRTPMHDWAVAHGAVFEDVGAWKRANYFPGAGETRHDAVLRECRTVRESVGIFDASTLGKIEVVGRDAAIFLDRLYVNSWATLQPGRARYGILLNEAGFVIDDGVIARCASDRFHVTTTTGGAARVLAMMEDYLQTEWPDLRVWLTSTTEQWAVIAVQGPRARDVLAPLVNDIDLGREAFPHMAMREGHIAGIEARIFRVSFTGELGFEVNVPAGHGADVIARIAKRAFALGGCVYGTEAMHVLRAEKGFIIVGQETDGTVTPDDLGLGWAIGKKKRDFVGKRSLARPDMRVAQRPQLVGLLTRDRKTLLDEGAQLVSSADPPPGTPALGHVTSSYKSAALDRSIALGLLAGGRSRHGELIFATTNAGTVQVEVVAPNFYDPQGARLDA